MKLKNIDINKTVEDARALLKEEQNISASLRAIFEVLLLVITLLAAKFKLNSKNSSVPPSADPNRTRVSKDKKTAKKRGGQPGHPGYRLEKVAEPDEIEILKVDKKQLPKGKYHEAGYEARQAINIRISTIITEYRAQILENEKGQRFMAEFPFGITRDIQYGSKVKSHSVYMSQFQLIPYKRIEDYFSDQMDIALSGGSIFNFNQEAYQLLEKFDLVAKYALIKSPIIHSDETGINVDKKRIWLHSASNKGWVYFYPHAKRGREAMDEINILPRFKGILCHDHWKPYYGYDCLHALCNAHHLRELTLVADEDKQQWAIDIRALLVEINATVHDSGGVLSTTLQLEYGKKYDAIITAGEIECPVPPPPDTPKKGRIKKSKSRNLLERLRDYKEDVLRFMTVDLLPFTNNTAENDIRMTKVQQKISGCFRSMEGAYIFCRVRSYILTCQKNGLSASESLDVLFQGKLPHFIENEFKNIPAS